MSGNDVHTVEETHSGRKDAPILRLLVVLTLSLVALACAQQSTPVVTSPAVTPTRVPGGLMGTSWELLALEGIPVIAGTHITLEVDHGSAGGFTGCNSYGARLDSETNRILSDGTFQLKETATTLIGCLEPEGVGRQESNYLDLLRRGTTFQVVSDRLFIRDGSGAVILEYVQSLNPPKDPGSLLGAAWRLTSIDGVPAAHPASIAFHGDARASGEAGCRAYVATVSTDGNELAFTSTSMIGEPCDDLDRARFEGDFTTALGWTRHYAVRGSTLELKTARGELLEFERSTADGEIPGVRWVLMALVAADSVLVREPLAGPIPTIEFAENSVSGSGGCNAYTAEYTLADGVLTVGPVAATKKACITPAGLMGQESEFLNALAVSTSAALHGGKLWLTAPGGSALVFEKDASGTR